MHVCMHTLVQSPSVQSHFCGQHSPLSSYHLHFLQKNTKVFLKPVVKLFSKDASKRDPSSMLKPPHLAPFNVMQHVFGS